MRPFLSKQDVFVKITALFVVLIVFFVAVSVMDRVERADAVAPPNILGYQGRVLNANGVPVSSASVDMIFEIYDASAGGTCVWSNTSSSCATATARTVTLVDGLFSERLGDTGDTYSAITDATFGDNAELYLQITIEGEALTPRTRITSAPYATNADMLDGIDSSSFIQTTGCTDCLDFTSLSNSMTVDEDTTIDLSSLDLFYNLTSSGNVTFQDSGTNFAIFSGNPNGGQIDFTANNDLAGGAFFDIDSGNQQTTSDLVALTANTMEAGNILNIVQDPNSLQTVAASGNALRVYRELTQAASTSTGSLLYINSDNDNGIATDNSYLLELYQENTASTGYAFRILNEGAGGIMSLNHSIGAGASSPGIQLDIGQTGYDQKGIDYTYSGTEQAFDLITATDGSANNPLFQISNTDTAYDQFLIDVTNTGTTYLANLSTTGTGGGIFLSGDASASTLLAIENTETGYAQNSLNVRHDGSTSGFSITSAAGATATDPLVFITNSNSAYDVDLATINYDGTASALSITSQGTGISDTVVSISGDNADYVMELYNDGNNDNRQGIYLQTCLDTNPTTACNFATFADGNGTVLGAIEGDGAGGVTNASAGSDYAELFELGTAVSLGDVVALNADGRVEPAQRGDQIIGAYSSNPNVLGNWFENWEQSGTHAAVALLGQVPVNVNDEGGAISAGDYLELSSVTGVVKKASGVGFVIGRALEDHDSGSGQIMTFIEPKWVALDLIEGDDSAIFKRNLEIASDGDATAASNKDSNLLSLSGSAWDGVSAVDRSMSIFTDITSDDIYSLVIQNNDGETSAYFEQDGDLVLGGKLYLADQGNLQTDTYLYYDGSGGPGGDFIRTNAAGWGTGSYDFAEMFPSKDDLDPGEIVVFAHEKDHVMRSSGETYDNRIAGIVSTRPGFLAGENKPGHVPIALSGRVPTKVSTENGAISIGDPLTTSSLSGTAMLATQPGHIVGYALEGISEGEGMISVFVRPSYYDGGSVFANNVASGVSNADQLDPDAVMSFSGNALTNIMSIAGIGDAWSIAENGDITIRGRVQQIATGYDGSDIVTSAIQSEQAIIELVGTAQMINGRATIKFDDTDTSFSDIISLDHPYHVFMTPSGPVNTLYTSHRDRQGFIIRETDGESNAQIDWMVIGYHKDYAPELTTNDNVVDENTAESPAADDAESNESELENTETDNTEITEEQDSETQINTDEENNSVTEEVQDVEGADTDVEQIIEETQVDESDEANTATEVIEVIPEETISEEQSEEVEVQEETVDQSESETDAVVLE